jgi:hypothetical protein
MIYFVGKQFSHFYEMEKAFINTTCTKLTKEKDIKSRFIFPFDYLVFFLSRIFPKNSEKSKKPLKPGGVMVCRTAPVR